MRNYTSSDHAKITEALTACQNPIPGTTVNISSHLMQEVLKLAQHAVSIEAEFGDPASNFAPAGLIDAVMREVENGLQLRVDDEEPYDLAWPPEPGDEA
jgi:hypothetical protein